MMPSAMAQCQGVYLDDGKAAEPDEGVAVAIDDDVAGDAMLLPCLPGGHSVLQL